MKIYFSENELQAIHVLKYIGKLILFFLYFCFALFFLALAISNISKYFSGMPLEKITIDFYFVLAYVSIYSGFLLLRKNLQGFLGIVDYKKRKK